MASTSRRSAAGHCLKTSLLPERGLAEQGAAERHSRKNEAGAAPGWHGTGSGVSRLWLWLHGQLEGSREEDRCLVARKRHGRPKATAVIS